jgi:predicted AlkP superfamily pyrophosphatase or phosphodiesterase
MKRFFWVVLTLIVGVGGRSQDTTQKIVSGRTNSKKQLSKPYLILISADGFRYDFAKKYQANNLLKLGASGVVADAMIPAFPSLTFPNHYSIVTGLYPAHHGLVDNSVYDRKKNRRYSMSNKLAVRDSSWYGGMPLWTVTEKNRLLAASFYWVGSEAAVNGIRPTYYYFYNDRIEIDRRIQIVKEWLMLPEEKRPHFISIYFSEVDHAAHAHGPDSKETRDAVTLIDDAIANLVIAVQSTGLPVNFIFLSDHGMIRVDNEHPLHLPSVVDSSRFTVTGGEALVQLHAKKREDVLPVYRKLKDSAADYDVYLGDSLPPQWHYSQKDDPYDRIADIILIPRLPRIFNLSGKPATPGKHGFDPFLPEMQASFIAWGPAFKKGVKIPAFENVHVYPLVLKILGLKSRQRIDGKPGVLEKTLQ